MRDGCLQCPPPLPACGTDVGKSLGQSKTGHAHHAVVVVRIEFLPPHTPQAWPAHRRSQVLEGTIYDLVREGTETCDGGMLGPLIDVLSGCAYLHACRPPLLHRDLKPPNVLYDEKRRCKLCDFGTAIELHANAPLPTEWIGSQLYVAPEIDAGKAYGTPADVFSFGVLCYELYHLQTHGVDFYGEGNLFDGGGLLEGLEIVRTPILKTPQEYPERPSSCEIDAVWSLVCECLRAEPAERPTFAVVATRMGEARQAIGGGLASWLNG